MNTKFPLGNEWWIYGWSWNQYHENIYTDLAYADLKTTKGLGPVTGKIAMEDQNYR